MDKSWSSIEDVRYYFSRSSVKFRGYTAQKNKTNTIKVIPKPTEHKVYTTHVNRLNENQSWSYPQESYAKTAESTFRISFPAPAAVSICIDGYHYD